MLGVRAVKRMDVDVSKRENRPYLFVEQAFDISTL